MAYYWKLRKFKLEHRHHVANRLLALRKALRDQVSNNKRTGELRIATWNLMHFGGSGSYKRTTESLLYIAEIIDHFDLVSVQEVKRDLTQLKDLVLNYLGDDWDYIVSDVSEGSAGNSERMAVLYRKGRVQFSRMAGEIVLPPEQSVASVVPLPDNSKLAQHRQLARSPYYLGFQAGWFKFKLCSVHIHYGKKTGLAREIRIAEIKRLAQLLTKRSDVERKAEVKFARSKKWDTTPSAANYILLGDFNIHDTKHDRAMKALTENGFQIPDEIKGMSTNTGKDEQPFDQIALRLHDSRFKQGAGGVFDYRRLIYRLQDSDFYWKTIKLSKLKEREARGDNAKEIKAYFANYYRKHQISDHLLLWTSFNIDYANDYLQELSEEK